ncbi:MAG: response regulator [Elusimicrobia bacterium]|nr:response regulator [Elusimicrobiota bacterium]
MDDEAMPAPATKLVLLVDDDESLLDLMEHVVKKEGFRTDRAADGPEALRKAQALHPDLMVLDMMLPGMGGYEVIRELQAAGCGDVAIMVVTGRQMDPGGIQQVRGEPNVREFMQKPLRPAFLAAALHRLLGTRPGGGA